MTVYAVLGASGASGVRKTVRLSEDQAVSTAVFGLIPTARLFRSQARLKVTVICADRETAGAPSAGLLDSAVTGVLSQPVRASAAQTAMNANR